MKIRDIKDGTTVNAETGKVTDWATPTPRWEEIDKRFEKFYLELTDERKWKNGKPVVGNYVYVTFGNAILSFLHSELSQVRAETIKEIGEIVINEVWNPDAGRATVVKNIRQKLKDLSLSTKRR